MLADLEIELCVYCGASAECREHVIPISYLGFFRTYDKSKMWIVPACNTCNKLAGAKIFFSIPDKAKYILTRFKQKYKKILNQAEWTQNEMDDMDYNFQQMIWGSLVAKRVAHERVKHLESISNYTSDWNRPSFVESMILEYKRLQKSTRKKRKKRRIPA